MELIIGEYKCYINPNTGVSLPVPRGYEARFRGDIDYVMNEEMAPLSVLDKSYTYETVNISLNLTKNCNLACKYCFNKNKENKSLNYDDAVRFIEFVIQSTPNAKQYTLDLAGSGEPLLEYEKILKIAEYAYNKSNEIHKHILLQFVCNGTLLTEEKVKRLQDAGILFGVSIDGTKKAHNENRVDRGGKGTFDTIIKNVKAIKHREYLGAAVTMSNNNIDILNTVKFLSKYFSTISVKIVRPENGERLNYELINEGYKELTKYILKEASKGKIDTLVKLLNGDDFFAKFIFRVFGNTKCFSRCDAGIGKFALASNNDIYCCSGAVGEERLKLGSLSTSIDFDLARRLQASTFDNDTCKHCKYNAICSGECLVTLTTNKQVNTDMCHIKKYLIELALYLKAEFMYKYEDLFEKIINLLQEKGNRSLGDNELIELSKKTDKYTFMELKALKDKDLDAYNKVKEELK